MGEKPEICVSQESELTALGDIIVMIEVYGNMDWFSAAEQPNGFDELPPVFLEGFELWEADAAGNANLIVEKLAPYIGATFVADNIEGWEDYLDDSSFGEFLAKKIRVVGIDFSVNPPPLVKVEAWFDVELTASKTSEAFAEWIDEEHEGELYSCIVFSWDFDLEEDLDSLEDLDLTVGDHQGCEAHIV